MNKTVSSQSIKRPGSAIAGASGSGSKKRSRRLVEIPEDVWLEALKSLSGMKWSKMRLVSRELSGVVQRNVSRLPLAIIDYAAMLLKKRNRIEPKIIVADSPISPNAQWFQNGGIALDAPADIQLAKAVIAADLKEKWCVDLCVLGPDQEKKLKKYEKGQPWFSGNEWLCGRQFKSKVLFYGEFNPLRSRSSAASLAFFLKLLSDPSTFVGELWMYAFDKKLKGILFAGEEERYIRCGTFTLMGKFTSADQECESILWMEKNVQADTIKFHAKNVDCENSEFCDAISNYILGASWTSANQVVNLGDVEGIYAFFKSLIKKFRTVPAVQSTFPIVVFFGFIMTESLRDPLKHLLYKESKVKEKLEDAEDDEDPENSDDEDESEDSKKDENYIISSESNQMRVELFRKIYSPSNAWYPVYHEYYYGVRITMEARK
ncbi:hypothetical protein DdX_16722 [Ditylenchus destructor]|uniref:Uncharacterized protein n=1 Tax=Ditylenchus destructor TaxID=166010 RepID=A0AAD4QZN3_9BILA|nr:hypothetical protein DdX_16722 [Ditylenchus destructor]